jgi:hypothetical protein
MLFFLIVCCASVAPDTPSIDQDESTAGLIVTCVSGKNSVQGLESRIDLSGCVVVHRTNSHCAAGCNDSEGCCCFERVIVAMPGENIALGKRRSDCGRRVTVMRE